MPAVLLPSSRVDATPSSKPDAPSAFASDPAYFCILEPICLEEFMFSTCPHPDVPCVRHRCEMLADGEGERAYGTAAWKRMKSVDPIALVQIIEEIRRRDPSLVP